jgi:multidrug efflux pump subunit AcrB
VGRRDFRIRTVAQFNSVEDISCHHSIHGQRRIIVGDVAEVGVGYEKLTVPVMQNMKDGIAIERKRPQPGTNILELTDRVERLSAAQ